MESYLHDRLILEGKKASDAEHPEAVVVTGEPQTVCLYFGSMWRRPRTIL